MTLPIEDFIPKEECCSTYGLDDYSTETARWCKGCGGHSVLGALQRMLRDHQEAPENLVCVSGIGCSSRFPHYLRAYGFHTLHGRALPVSVGVSLARPELKLLTIMGDGDCFSIGGNHWLHTLRYNINTMVVVLDNEIYALTKKQMSPTSRLGTITNTSPRGSYLEPMNPLSIALGVTNISFVAQTASWLPGHLQATLDKAWQHKGLAFVRVLQRCPVYMPGAFSSANADFPAMFLESPEGIPVDKGILREAPTVVHSPRDINAAQAIAARSLMDREPLGLIYYNPDVPTYTDVRYSRMAKVDRVAKAKLLDQYLDHYSVGTATGE
ncbi:MAG TPA: thiamine pyrophosphate-dependent enzyme [Fibrobacteraceae bacterium]|nr:thiamine pyrophosphate-dependent enzyme [Fibrobacteraceae bacterium]